MANKTGPTRWGIISCGRISHDWAVGVSTLDPAEHKIVSAAARNVDSAKAFAKEHGIPKVHDSYDDLLKDPEVEVVYIGTVHTEHLNLCKAALDQGKHVLCEKPLGMNVRETQEIIEYARAKKRFFMEAIWSRFFPAYQKLKEELAKGTIGEPRQIIADMGVDLSNDAWRMDGKLGGGSTLDIGTYTIQLVTLVFKGLRPLKIVASGHLNESGAEVNASATLIFPGGKTATIATHNEISTPCNGIIAGSKGVLRLAYPMWSPSTLVTPTETFQFELPKSDKKTNFLNSVGLAYQCHEVRRCIAEGLVESPEMTWEDTLIIAEIRESIRKQVGVSYPQD